MRQNQPSGTGPTRREILGLVAGTAAVGALAGLRGLTDPAVSAEDLPAEPAIDTHIHVVHSGVPGVKPKPKEIEALYSGPVAGMAARIKDEMAKANVQIAFGMGSLVGPTDDPLGIARTLEISRLVPGVKAVGIADPRRIELEHLRAVEDQILRNRETIVALKAYLGYLHFGPEHPNYVPYYKIAATYHLPVIMHTGDNWSTKAHVKYAHPLRMDEVAVAHPDVRFVLAHIGNPWLTDAAEVIFKNPNVWADLSGLVVGDAKKFQVLFDTAKVPDSVAGLAISDLKKAIGYVEDYKRFLYATDWPLAPMSCYRRLIESLIPKEHHQEVFRTNAEHVFSLCASPAGSAAAKRGADKRGRHEFRQGAEQAVMSTEMTTRRTTGSAR
jgi:predicted TIM-barrel fold metal-dependent hydrolase